MAKIVLSTNIAESSITIPDVTAVVDMALCRSLEYNDERQMPALVLMHASRACMKQRAGRAPTPSLSLTLTLILTLNLTRT